MLFNEINLILIKTKTFFAKIGSIVPLCPTMVHAINYSLYPGSTVVEPSTHHRMIEGSNPASRIGRDEMVKKCDKTFLVK
jgi:hypothetical protein